MLSELSKPQKCLSVRNGVEIWIDSDKADQVVRMIGTMQGRSFFEIDGRAINVADLVGIFKPEDMDALTRRKNGQWQCKYGNWHEKHGDCNCYVVKATSLPDDPEITDDQREANCERLRKMKLEFTGHIDPKVF